MGIVASRLTFSFDRLHVEIVYLHDGCPDNGIYRTQILEKLNGTPSLFVDLHSKIQEPSIAFCQFADILFLVNFGNVVLLGGQIAVEC